MKMYLIMASKLRAGDYIHPEQNGDPHWYSVEDIEWFDPIIIEASFRDCNGHKGLQVYHTDNYILLGRDEIDQVSEKRLKKAGMKTSQKAMRDINTLIDNIDQDRITTGGVVDELNSIHGYLAIIEAEGDQEDDEYKG